MAEKTVGYIEMEWMCKRCGTKNPGLQKTCTNCGAPMAEQDQFDLPAGQTLITDAEKLAQAERGPDMHCPYCGARNPAGSAECVQCGGNLEDARAREKGRVLGAYQPGAASDVKCPACESLNPAGAARCANCGGSLVAQPASAAPSVVPAAAVSNRKAGLVFTVIGVLLCLGLLAVFVLANRTNDAPAIVQGVHWERSIQVLELRPAEHTDWEDALPSGSVKGSCSEKLREVQSDPAPGAEEVCGTPYTVDQGSGMAKVVQDCEYHIYDNWCGYTIDEWQVVDGAVVQGSDLNPSWPAIVLLEGQREGERQEEYQVTFRGESDGNTYPYRVSDPVEFARFTPGSRWVLKVNTFGNVLDAQQR